MKIWRPILIILGLIPFGFIISLLSFYLHAGQLLGRLPRANSNHPQLFSIYSTYQPLVELTGELWIYSFIAWIFLVAIYLFRYRKDASLGHVIFSAIGQGLAVILFCSEICVWYAD